jgi:squalene monooxygenase
VKRLDIQAAAGVNPAMERTDILIVGSGMAGVTAALALAGTGRRVLLLEAHHAVDGRFRGELIHPVGVRVLRDLGLLPALRAAVPIDGFAILPAPLRPSILLPYGEVPGACPTGLSAHHVALLESLRSALSTRPEAELRMGERVVDVVRRGGRVAGVRTAHGEEILAELTVIADGRHSKLRGVVGIAEKSRLLSFTAGILLRDAALPHPGYGHVMFAPHGTVLAYPIDRGAVRLSFDVPLALTRGSNAIEARIAENYAPHLPEPLRGALLRALQSTPVEVCANHAMTTRSCVVNGAALVGDSAGCSHPLTASGIMIGLNDARILAEELRAGGGVDAALTRYQRRRYKFARARDVLADALHEVLVAQDDTMRAAREGLFDYWRLSARARAASMALLSGEVSDYSAFLIEYIRVLGISVRHSSRRRPGGVGRATLLGGLVSASYRQAVRIASEMTQDLADRALPRCSSAPPPEHHEGSARRLPRVPVARGGPS